MNIQFHNLFRNTDEKHTLEPSHGYGSKSISILCHANKHYTLFFMWNLTFYSHEIAMNAVFNIGKSQYNYNK